jgi:hypothetical protein
MKAAHRHHGAVAHVHVHGGRAFFQPHEGRAAIAPDRDAHGLADRQRQRRQLGAGQADRVGLLQADQPQLQRQCAEAVAAAGRLLLDEAELAEAHQVGMGLGRRHVGLAGQVLQRHRPAVVHQRQQQPPAHLDALDAARAALAIVFGAVHCRHLTPSVLLLNKMNSTLSNRLTIINRLSHNQTRSS